jgi:hypothetical protein
MKYESSELIINEDGSIFHLHVKAGALTKATHVPGVPPHAVTVDAFLNVALTAVNATVFINHSRGVKVRHGVNPAWFLVQFSLSFFGLLGIIEFLGFIVDHLGDAVGLGVAGFDAVEVVALLVGVVGVALESELVVLHDGLHCFILLKIGSVLVAGVFHPRRKHYNMERGYLSIYI